MSARKQKPKKKCATKYCRRLSEDGSRHCWRCRSRKQKENSPGKYYYARAKASAKRRGKEFTVTYRQWIRAWKRATGWAGVGPKPDGYEVDRVDRAKGYVPGNLQVIPGGLHRVKSVMETRGLSLAQITRRMKVIAQASNDECPF